MTDITLTPAEFTLVKFDAATCSLLAERSAKAVDFPDDVDVAVEVDEVLPAPLIGSFVDVVDGKVSLWFTGGSFEDSRYQGQIHEVDASTELAGPLSCAAVIGSRVASRTRRPTRRSPTVSARCGTSTPRAGSCGSASRCANRDAATRSGSTAASTTSPMRSTTGSGALTTHWADVEATAAKLEAADSRPVVKKQVLRRESLRDMA